VAARRRGNKRERTRAQLLDAAAHVIRERGFYGTTLEAVAQRARMTRGAIYGNFTDKEELFGAVAETRWRPIVPLKHGSTLREHLALVADAVVAAIPARRAQALGALSFQIYALTNERMRTRMADANAELYRRAADRLQQAIPADQLPMPAEEFVRVLHALTDGLLLLRVLQPELVTEDLIRKAFEALANS
jgi:AcrR family transcriptional regulator